MDPYLPMLKCSMGKPISCGQSYKHFTIAINDSITMVLAQLVDWSLSIPEVRGSNPVIGKIY